MQKIFLTVFTLTMILGCLGQPGDRLEATFVGERDACDGVFARVNAVDDFKQVDGEAIVEVVAQSFANALKSPDGAKAEAQAIGKKVLEVTATAEATLEVTINSPTQGCWAVGYGTAEARAIASAVVEAFAKGISVALGDNVSSFAIAEAKTKEESVAEAVASVALLLFSGDGSGQQQQTATAVAEAKAVAINCAFAEAFAEVYKDTDTAVSEAIVQAGCPPPLKKVIGITGRAVSKFSCGCKKDVSSSQVANAGCGGWGGADEICYVLDPEGCSCAQKSMIYPGEKWRFCGSTLKTMNSSLNFQQEQIAPERFGFCPKLINSP